MSLKKINPPTVYFRTSDGSVHSAWAYDDTNASGWLNRARMLVTVPTKGSEVVCGAHVVSAWMEE